MGIFRRRSDRDGSGGGTGPADPAFAFLSTEQGSTLRRLVRETLAEHGLEVTVHADHAVDAQGREFGLGNLAAACHNTDGGEREWPRLVRHHLSTVLRGMDEPPPFDTLPTGGLHASTYSRVIGEDALAPGLTEYARPVAPGLVEVLNVDLPDSVAFYTVDLVDEHGGVDDLFRIGRVNLRGVEPDDRAPVEHEGASIQVLMGDSMFFASTLLHLDDVVLRETGTPLDPEVGVLFAVPFRHQIAFHVPRDVSVLPSLHLLAGFAAAGYADAVGPLSPDVYWWRGGRIDRVTRQTPEGVAVDVDSELAGVLERFTGGG